MRVRYLGRYALTPDNVNRASPETTISLRGAYRFRRTMLYAELFNITDAAGKDIVYWYEAYVPGSTRPAGPSNDIDCNSGAVDLPFELCRGAAHGCSCSIKDRVCALTRPGSRVRAWRARSHALTTRRSAISAMQACGQTASRSLLL